MSRAATDERVFEALTTTGIPGTRTAWAEGTAPPMPWFTYRCIDGGETFADDGNFAALPRYRAELHTAEVDYELIEAFEWAVSAIGPYSFDDQYDYETGAFVAVFEFVVS